MSLTGQFFLGLVAALAVAAFVAVVVLWPAVARPTPGKLAARTVMLLLVNALVLLTAATQLNAKYLFFADWTDLKGALTGHVVKTTLARGAAASQAAWQALLPESLRWLGANLSGFRAVA